MKHQVSWVSIPSKDFKRAVSFYETLTGKTFKCDGEGDKQMATCLSEDDWKEQVVGFGITGDTSIEAGSQGPRVYLAIKDIDDYLSRVEEAGGKIITPKSEMGEYGFWALIEDTEGNHIGFHSM